MILVPPAILISHAQSPSHVKVQELQAVVMHGAGRGEDPAPPAELRLSFHVDGWPEGSAPRFKLFRVFPTQMRRKPIPLALKAESQRQPFSFTAVWPVAEADGSSIRLEVWLRRRCMATHSSPVTFQPRRSARPQRDEGR